MLIKKPVEKLWFRTIAKLDIFFCLENGIKTKKFSAETNTFADWGACNYPFGTSFKTKIISPLSLSLVNALKVHDHTASFQARGDATDFNDSIFQHFQVQIPNLRTTIIIIKSPYLRFGRVSSSNNNFRILSFNNP